MKSGDGLRSVFEPTSGASRRTFIRATLAAALAGTASGAQTKREPADAMTVKGHSQFVPEGELMARIDMTLRRLTTDGVPSFTDRFVLADVALDPSYPRRFSNYSGDLSGRYIGALSLIPPPDDAARVDGLARQILTFQREDGRFGDTRLSFAPGDIDREQMALLWGNGRLLVGLLEYSATHSSPDTLAGAKKLAQFLLGVCESCARPEVMKRLVGQGASGFICFTQLIEPFALLGARTGERRYLDAAARIIPWLQPRGNQHSHGYLTTLRGIAELYGATSNPDHLRFVETAYRDLLFSADYTLYGGVPEYFGKGPGDVRADERGRDEGCSEADFVRLSLQLWRATGKVDYLERAERCLLNEFYFNQFSTGDFGHHTAYRYGYQPTESIARAWWCCTMHGLRAFRDVLDSAVTATEDHVKVNLFLDGAWNGGPLPLDLTTADPSSRGSSQRFRIVAGQSTTGEVSIALRRPSWLPTQEFFLNGTRHACEEKDGYAVVQRKWRRGDVLECSLDYRLQAMTASGETLSLRAFGEHPIEAALFCGPHLLAADSGSEPAFFGEPWMGNSPVDSNVLLLPGGPDSREPVRTPRHPLEKPAAHRSFEYTHGGWPEKHSILLRPISEQTSSEPHTVAALFRLRRG